MSNIPLFSLRTGRPVACFAGLLVAATIARADEPAYVLPKIATYSAQVANQTPVATFAMPVSGLRFEPRVDVQARNLAEGQADVAIRGGLTDPVAQPETDAVAERIDRRVVHREDGDAPAPVEVDEFGDGGHRPTCSPPC